MPKLIPSLAALVLLLGVAPVAAQDGGMQASGRRAMMGRWNPNEPIRSTPGAPRNEAGPRLEPGATFCRTPADLDRRVAAVTARANGTAEAPGLPAECQLIAQRMPVEIVERRGLGQTQVRLTTAGDRTGWTDAWLPQSNAERARAVAPSIEEPGPRLR